jgi:hypothetical protein
VGGWGGGLDPPGLPMKAFTLKASTLSCYKHRLPFNEGMTDQGS